MPKGRHEVAGKEEDHEGAVIRKGSFGKMDKTVVFEEKGFKGNSYLLRKHRFSCFSGTPPVSSHTLSIVPNPSPPRTNSLVPVGNNPFQVNFLNTTPEFAKLCT